jgi:hypothetical protein
VRLLGTLSQILLIYFVFRAVLVWVGNKPVGVSGSTKRHPTEEDDVAVEAADLEKRHQNLFKELEKYLEPVESVHVRSKLSSVYV